MQRDSCPGRFFQNGAHRLKARHGDGVFLLPAGFPPAAVGAQPVVDGVGHPAPALLPAGQPLIDLVDGVGQAGKALGRRVQPGGRRRQLRPSSTLGGVVRQTFVPQQQPAGHKQADCGPRPEGRQITEGRSGRLDRQNSRQRPAHVKGDADQLVPLGKQSQGRAQTDPHPAAGEVRPGAAEASRGGGRPAEGRLSLAPAGQRQGVDHRRRQPQTDRPGKEAAQRRRPAEDQHQTPGPLLFGRGAAKQISHPGGQHCVRPRKKQSVPADVGFEAPGAAHQQDAPGQRRRQIPPGPEPPGRHRPAHRADQADGPHPLPPQQQRQHRPRPAGGKAVLPQAQDQPQPQGTQLPVQHRPSAGKARRQPKQLPQGRPAPARLNEGLSPLRAAHRQRAAARPKPHKALFHRRFPLLQIFVMPGPACAYTLAGPCRTFCRRKQERPKPPKEEQKTPAGPFLGRAEVFFCRVCFVCARGSRYSCTAARSRSMAVCSRSAVLSRPIMQARSTPPPGVRCLPDRAMPSG